MPENRIASLDGWEEQSGDQVLSELGFGFPREPHSRIFLTRTDLEGHRLHHHIVCAGCFPEIRIYRPPVFSPPPFSIVLLEKSRYRCVNQRGLISAEAEAWIGKCDRCGAIHIVMPEERPALNRRH